MADDSLKKRSTVRGGRSHANAAAAAAANNICRAVSGCSSSKVQTPNSPLSYFFSITIAQPKIRIKIPKVLAKTMRRRSDHGHDQCNDNLNKPKKFFGKKFDLVWCKVFGHKKVSTHETCSSKCENGKVCSNGMGTSGGLAEGKRAKILEKVEFDDMQWVKSTMRSCEIDVNGDRGKQSRDVAEVASPNLKNILESEEEGGKKKKKNTKKKQERLEDDDQGRRQQHQPCRQYKQGQLSFKIFFKKKKNSLSFFGGNKRSNSSRSNGVPATDIVIGRKENSSERLKKARSTANNLHEQIGAGGGRKEIVDEELCKKRILMGEKCRPLSHSGGLHYDKDGTLLTEVLP